MKTNWLIILCFVFALFVSCEEDNELRNSIFIYDQDNTDLPAYSEWGYNTFGALYERDVFVSNEWLVPAKVIVSDTGLTLQFSGDRTSSSYYSWSSSEMTMSFNLSGLKPEHFTDLVVFNDSIIDLTHPSCKVSIAESNNDYEVDIIEGKLYIKRVQILQVDKQEVEAILSGYFDLKAKLDSSPVTISDGRFDVGIGRENFFEY